VDSESTNGQGTGKEDWGLKALELQVQGIKLQEASMLGKDMDGKSSVVATLINSKICGGYLGCPYEAKVLQLA
jgi:hypothetical protein